MPDTCTFAPLRGFEIPFLSLPPPAHLAVDPPQPSARWPAAEEPELPAVEEPERRQASTLKLLTPATPTQRSIFLFYPAPDPIQSNPIQSPPYFPSTHICASTRFCSERKMTRFRSNGTSCSAQICVPLTATSPRLRFVPPVRSNLTPPPPPQRAPAIEPHIACLARFYYCYWTLQTQ